MKLTRIKRRQAPALTPAESYVKSVLDEARRKLIGLETYSNTTRINWASPSNAPWGSNFVPAGCHHDRVEPMPGYDRTEHIRVILRMDDAPAAQRMELRDSLAAEGFRVRNVRTHSCGCETMEVYPRHKPSATPART